jgi:surface polysaccharide O-acyltransferase-like enzyme
MTLPSDSKDISFSKEAASDRPRLMGLDLLRGLAMVAVILLHADEWGGVEKLPGSWPTWVELSNFAVPFFLAASFYLSVSKLIASPQQPFPLRTRLSRLMIPYVSWTVIYLVYKIIRYGLLGKLSLLQSLASDPILIIFVGGAGFHLYFLPLLMTGTALLKPLSGWLLKYLRGWVGSLLLLVSIILYEGLIATKNTVDIASGIAFAGWFDSAITHNFLLRPLWVYLAWGVRCLPYIAFAVLLSPWISKQLAGFRSWGAFLGWAIVFLGINLYGYRILPPGLLEVSRGYAGVFFAIALSYRLQPHPLIVSLGSCSFGIYLSHLLFLEVLQTVWIRLSPVTARSPSLGSLFGIIGLTFGLSWGLTYILMQRRSLAKGLLGT